MLPVLKTGNETAKQYTVTFRGLNWGQDWTEGELSHCENLSASRFPCLSQRPPRRELGRYPDPGGLISKDGLLVVSGGTVFHNDNAVGQVTPGRKQLAAIGDYVVIFPDKAYYNTARGEFGDLEAEAVVTGAVFTDAAITAEGVTFPFRTGDAVTITGCAAGENNRTVILRSVEEGVLGVYESTFVAAEETGTVTLRREVPELDFICESNYRLWGTHGSTIYGSRYGDPFNFQVFDGLSGDSYFIDVASEGAFTGCIPYSGHICFFKEHTLHKLYGSKPGNFQVVTAQVCGVEAGSEKSLCVLNETLYYKGIGGVYAYTGGVPERVSAAFGSRQFANACAAADGECYYLSAEGEDGWHLLTYDVHRGIWLREDALHCADMARCGGHVYLLSEDGVLWQAAGGEDTERIPWSVTFCPFSETVLSRKGYSKFHLRLELEEGAWLQAQLRRDNEETWETICITHGGRARTVSIPVLPARCDRVELRLSGQGKCLLRTLVRELTVGSDV